MVLCEKKNRKENTRRKKEKNINLLSKRDLHLGITHDSCDKR